MTRLVWIMLLFCCSIGAKLQDVSDVPDVCAFRLNEWKKVLIENQDRCSADVTKAGANLERTMREELETLKNEKNSKDNEILQKVENVSVELKSLKKEVDEIIQKVDNISLGQKTLEDKLSTKAEVDQGLKSLKSELISRMDSNSNSQYQMLTALTSRIENLAELLKNNNTLHLETSGCDSWKQKLGNTQLTKLSTRFYHFSTIEINWRKAQEFCRNHGMQLASFETEEEMKIVAEAVPKKYNGHWVGASDISRQPGHMHWTDGRAVDKSWFKPGQLDDFGSGRETCIYLWPTYEKLGDILCSHTSYQFICEVSAENSHCV